MAKNEAAMAEGGEERVKRLHEEGRLTARERLNLLFDEGTFQEIDDISRTAAQTSEWRLNSFWETESLPEQG